MNTRDAQLIALRPELPQVSIHDQMSDQEFFQNKTLRPILKLQNDLLLALFRHYIEKHKGVFYEISPQRKMDYIESAIHKDTQAHTPRATVILPCTNVAHTRRVSRLTHRQHTKCRPRPP